MKYSEYLCQHPQILALDRTEQMAKQKLTNIKQELKLRLQLCTASFLKIFPAAKAANKFADEPELTINAYLDPIFFAKASSNFLVFSAMVILLEFKTFLPAAISFELKPFSKSSYLYFFFMSELILIFFYSLILVNISFYDFFLELYIKRYKLLKKKMIILIDVWY